MDNCCETAFQDFGTRSCPQIDVPDISHLKSQRLNSENQIYSMFNPTSDSDLEEGVNEKQHHESEDGVLFTLQRLCILYRTGVRYILYAIVLTQDDALTVSINSKSQSNQITSQ